MIHVRTWSGSCGVRITDMANAGKRGKKCQTFHFSGWSCTNNSNDDQRTARLLTLNVVDFADRIDPTATSFESAVSQIESLITGAKLPSQMVTTYRNEIRGIDAPRIRLEIRTEKWTATADETGICLCDLTDHNNEPRMITGHGQSSVRAYDIAKKVWSNLFTAQTMYQAGNILSSAGCDLHSFCAMD